MNTKAAKIILLLVCLLAMGAYGYTYWTSHLRDRIDPPTIHFSGDSLSISVKDDEAALLADVSATDPKDGDVTDSLMIESLSKLLPGNERIVTYVAFGGEDRVGKADRRIIYTDYEKPRFYLTGALTMSSANAYVTDALRSIGATDCLDGDITNKIVILGTEAAQSILGEQFVPIRLQAFNSCGDVAEISLRVLVQGAGYMSTLRPALTEYLVYRKVGERFDPRGLLDTRALSEAGLSSADVEIVSDVNLQQAGCYTVLYIVQRDEAKAVTPLTVVVEE